MKQQQQRVNSHKLHLLSSQKAKGEASCPWAKEDTWRNDLHNTQGEEKGHHGKESLKFT